MQPTKTLAVPRRQFRAEGSRAEGSRASHFGRRRPKHRVRRSSRGQTPPSGSSYVPGLDGIRAFAVVCVMAFHGGAGWARGGFLGVDVFFVLSGFLITSLLLEERWRRGRIGLRRFWARRARRLLPGLLLMVLVVLALAPVLVAPEARGDLRADALATLGYVANWHQIISGQGYFASAAPPSPLLHTWSLAIEEQFYLVWPLVLVLLLRRGTRERRGNRTVLLVASAGAGLSALAMALHFRPGFDPSRAYYGTDTRAQAILVGAALAALLALRPNLFSRRGARWFAALTGACGAGCLAWMIANEGGSSRFLYTGGFLVAAVAAAGVITSTVSVPSGLLARGLSFSPLRYIGRISYGMYLWHWPVYLLLDGARTGLVSWELLGARFAATFVIAVVSYHAIEMPVRERGLGVLRTWKAKVATPLIGLVGGALLFAVTTSAGSAPALATAESSAQTAKPAPGAGSVRMLLEGDSVAVTLGAGWQDIAPRYGVSIENKAIIGCGLASGGDVLDRGVVEQNVVGALVVPCAQWPERFQRDVETARPDVAALLVGPWEVRDRTLGGRWEHIGEPDFDSYELANLQRAVDILGSRGAHVVLFTAPYDDQGESPSGAPWPEDDPGRIDALNGLLYQVEAANPGRVSVLDLNRLLSPSGRYQAVVNGRSVRYPDGLHISEAGATMLAPELLPLVSEIAHPAPG